MPMAFAHAVHFTSNAFHFIFAKLNALHLLDLLSGDILMVW